jgi:hypothetical protein
MTKLNTMLEETEGAIKNEQSRNTDNIEGKTQNEDRKLKR